MKKIDNVPWEVIGILLLMIMTIGLTASTGWLIFKLYRKYRPIVQAESDGFDIIKIEEKDGFFKLLLTGAVLCSPLYFLIYRYFSNHY